MNHRMAMVCAWGLTCAAQFCFGAELLQTYEASEPLVHLGQWVTTLGDINGDGADDFAVSTKYDYEFFPAVSGPGSVTIFSGATTQPMCKLYGIDENSPIGSMEFGLRIDNAGDVDNDTINDLIVAAPLALHPESGVPHGRAFVFSGRWIATQCGDRQLDGLIHTVSYPGDPQAVSGFGSDVAGVGDLNRDGHADFAVAAHAHDDACAALKNEPCADIGGIFIFDGKTGNLVRQHNGDHVFDFFGFSLAGLGDVDGDQVDDYAVGAPQPAGGTGYVRIYSGRTGALLATQAGDGIEDWFGVALADAGDVNSDGTSDVVVGAGQYGLFTTPGPGYMRVFSGAALGGQPLFTTPGQLIGEALGHNVRSIGDINQDGYDDIIAGAPGESTLLPDFAGRAYLISGFDGRIIETLEGTSPGDIFGTSVGSAGDIDGDGIQELIIGAGMAGFGGEAYLYSVCIPECYQLIHKPHDTVMTPKLP